MAMTELAIETSTKAGKLFWSIVDEEIKKTICETPYLMTDLGLRTDITVDNEFGHPVTKQVCPIGHAYYLKTGSLRDSYSGMFLGSPSSEYGLTKILMVFEDLGSSYSRRISLLHSATSFYKVNDSGQVDQPWICTAIMPVEVL